MSSFACPGSLIRPPIPAFYSGQRQGADTLTWWDNDQSIMITGFARLRSVLTRREPWLFNASEAAAHLSPANVIARDRMEYWAGYKDRSDLVSLPSAQMYEREVAVPA